MNDERPLTSLNRAADTALVAYRWLWLCFRTRPGGRGREGMGKVVKGRESKGQVGGAGGGGHSKSGRESQALISDLH